MRFCQSRNFNVSGRQNDFQNNEHLVFGPSRGRFYLILCGFQVMLNFVDFGSATFGPWNVSRRHFPHRRVFTDPGGIQGGATGKLAACAGRGLGRLISFEADI